MKWSDLRRLKENVIPHADWEMVLMRCFLLWPFWIVVTRSVVSVQPKPNGIAHFVDLTWLANPLTLNILISLFAVCGTLYALGFLMVPALGIITAILIAKGTLINSQGAINHALQLLTMVALTQWIVYCMRRPLGWSKRESHLQAVHWAKVTIAASYVSAALAKIFASSEFWIARAPYMALQVIKSNLQSYYNDLVMPTSWLAQQFPYWVLENRNLTRAIFTGGLILELLAFLALVNRRWALFIGVSMLLLHWSIQLLMDLEFKHHVYLLLIFFVNVPWLFYVSFQWLRNRGTRTSAVVS
ncbi:MAG TPA: hypothetical protein VF585_05845 [Chthoniobacterales bacterium]|jgi:hypothetical protein